MKKKITMHGEVNFSPVGKLPKGLKKVNVKGNYHVVGESETTGNDHRVEVLEKDKVEIYEGENGVLYMRNEVPVNVYCPRDGKHETQVKEPGIWEIDKAKEYDHLEEEIRNVAD